MTDFFVNHTRKHIVRAEVDAVFNITKNLRHMFSKHKWSIDDHIEFLNSDTVSNPRGRTLLILEQYTLENWQGNLKFFTNISQQEYGMFLMSDDGYATSVGPFGV